MDNQYNSLESLEDEREGHRGRDRLNSALFSSQYNDTDELYVLKDEESNENKTRRV
jgi:hypothetical protein